MKQKSVWRWLAVACCVLVLVWLVIPLGWGVFGIGSMLFSVAVAFILFFALRAPAARQKQEEAQKKKRFFVSYRIMLLCILLFVAVVTVFSLLMVSGTRGGPPPEDATVIILGSKVDGTVPSADLTSRIEAAAVYLREHPGAVAIASGGRGSGEDISEAEAIANGLIQRGIASSRILLENRSVNTKENLMYSLQMIKEKGLSDVLAIVTDEYHQYRARGLAARQGAEAYPVCAATPWYIFSSCYTRELLALVKYFIIR